MKENDQQALGSGLSARLGGTTLIDMRVQSWSDIENMRSLLSFKITVAPSSVIKRFDDRVEYPMDSSSERYFVVERFSDAVLTAKALRELADAIDPITPKNRPSPGPDGGHPSA